MVHFRDENLPRVVKCNGRKVKCTGNAFPGSRESRSFSIPEFLGMDLPSSRKLADEDTSHSPTTPKRIAGGSILSHVMLY